MSRPDHSPDYWNESSFAGMSDQYLLVLLAECGEASTGDPSDLAFMEAIRKELNQRDRLKRGLARTWGKI